MIRSLIVLLLFCSCNQYRKIHNNAFVVDTHNDLLSSVTLQGLSIEKNLKGKTHSDLGRLKAGGVDLQIFSIFCDEKYGNGTAYNYAIREIDSITAIAARNPGQLRMIPSGGKPETGVNYIQGMCGVEGGHMIEDDLAKIDSFFKRGVRYLTLTWNNSTSWASSAKDETSGNLGGRKAGLNEFGEKVVRRLNELNMFVDVSHIGEKTFWDVMRITTKPVIASHSSVYALCPVPRNLRDDQIKAIAKNGGVIHINLYSGFLDSTYRTKVERFHNIHKKEMDSLRALNKASYDANAEIMKMYPKEAQSLRPPLSIVIKHINYIKKLVGVDHVGIGSDFDGIESTPLGLDGVEDLPLITKALKKEGYSNAEINKILGGNFLRVLQEVSGVAEKKGGSSIAITGARIYASPDAAPIENGVIVVNNGRITSIGAANKIRIPLSITTIDAKGMVVMPGFWNSHVHFIEPWSRGADTASAKMLQVHLQKMLTSYGFTHVFEVATFHFADVLALRRRIEAGEVKGPSILSCGVPFTPPHGSPFYIAPLKLPEIGSPDSARVYVTSQIDSGADGIKIWSASPVIGRVVTMPVEIAKATTAAAHKRGKPVFAHPTSLTGASIAAAGGVDVLTHVAADDRQPWPQQLLDSMIRLHMAVIPTLKLFKWELGRMNVDASNNPLMTAAIEQLRQYAAAGGQILFGTDVGYMSDPDPSDEYQMMQVAGMKFRDIFRSLTTAPASRFGLSNSSAKLAPGFDADLVILGGDPENNSAALTNVVYTIRKGEIIYSKD